MASLLIRRLPLILLISAFIVLDFTLLFINLNLTHELNEDAQIINITGRQRMLSQRISKNLIMQSYAINIEQTNSRQELIDAADLFQNTLLALQYGGEIISADGQLIEMDAIDDTTSQDYIRQAFETWQPIYHLISDMQRGVMPDSYQVDLFAADGSNDLLTLMNDLTVRAEQISKENTAYLRVAQVIIFLLVLINFFTIVLRLDIINRHQSNATDQMKHMIEKLSEAVVLIDDQRLVVFANKSAEKVLELTVADMLGKPFNAFVHVPQKQNTCVINHRHYRINTAIVTTIPKELTMISLMDITEQMHLKIQSTRDVLTGLLNRNGLVEAYADLSRQTDQICCLFLDLDGFKKVNDNHGHPTGDLVLSIIAKRFHSCLKHKDILARIGGDEFVILIKNPATEQGLKELCDRLEHSVANPLVVGGKSCHLGVSIGIHRSLNQDQTLDDLIEAADRAMYRVKQAKKTTAENRQSNLKV